MNEFTAHLTLSSITTFLAIRQSLLLAPLLVIFRDLSGRLLVLAPGKYLSRSTSRVFPCVLVKSQFESRSGSSMAPLSFARIFLNLVNSGILFMDSQKLLQLLTSAGPTSLRYRRWASRYDSQCSGTFWRKTALNFLLVFFLSLFSSLVHHKLLSWIILCGQLEI